MATILHEKRRQLTADELALARREIVDDLAKIEDIEAEKKVAIKQFTDRLAPIKRDVGKLMRQVRTGLDIGREWCNVVVDPITSTVKFFVTKKVWDDETQMERTEDVLFDEKTFEEVGEAQLAMWQSEDDGITEDLSPEHFNANELERLRDFFDVEAIDFLNTISSPWPAPAAEKWLAATGFPHSVISVELRGGRLTSAMTKLAQGLLAFEEFEGVTIEQGAIGTMVGKLQSHFPYADIDNGGDYDTLLNVFQAIVEEYKPAEDNLSSEAA